MEYKIKAQKRKADSTAELSKLRQESLIPAVIYGHSFENLNVSFDSHSFTKIWEEAGESSLINLEVEGEKEPLQVLIKDIQKDPLTENIIHVDLHRIRMDEEVTAEVQLNFSGEAPAVKELGGNLVVSRDFISIRCLPKDLIASIDIDLSGLTDYDKSIHVKDLNISDKVKVLDSPELTIASVVAPKVEKAEEAAPVAEAAVAGEEAKGEAAKPGEGDTKAGGDTKKAA